MRRGALLGGGTLAVIMSVVLAQSRGPAQDQRPRVVGEWTGKWGIYSPPQEGAPQPPQHAEKEMRLDCQVVELSDGNWQATFEGECGRPYNWTFAFHAIPASQRQLSVTEGWLPLVTPAGL
jgi:hypothetical protein